MAFFPLSSWTAALLCHGAVARPGEAFLGAFWVHLVQINPSQQHRSSRNPIGMERGGICRNWSSRGAQNLLEEQLQLCFEHFLPAWGVTGPGCDSGRAGAQGSGVVYPLAGPHRPRSRIAGGFVQTRRAEAEGGLRAGNTGCKHRTFHGRTARSWAMQSHRRGEQQGGERRAPAWSGAFTIND